MKWWQFRNKMPVKSTLPPLIFFSGQSPSQDAKARHSGPRNIGAGFGAGSFERSVCTDTWHIFRSTPKTRYSSPGGRMFSAHSGAHNGPSL